MEELRSDVRRFLIERSDGISALFRPSVRRVVEFAHIVDEAVQSGGLDLESGWERAVIRAIESERGDAEAALRRVSGTPDDVLNDWREAVVARLAASGCPFGGAWFDLPRGRRYVRVDRFIRICVRDGILLPRHLENYRLETIPQELEISPLLVAPHFPRGVGSQFRRDPIKLSVEMDDLKRWAEPRAPDRSQRTSLVVLAGEQGLTGIVQSVADSSELGLVTKVVVVPEQAEPAADSAYVARVASLIVAVLNTLGPQSMFAVGRGNGLASQGSIGTIGVVRRCPLDG